jgi:UDP-N-acetylglucosamine--N-acetylmuramyl-(pentapeptide) pyrophosphoryl-undecaprenol N-acetylglucosamine transferase
MQAGPSAAPAAAPATFACIAAGGTGGHVLPGLAVARALVDRGIDPAAIRFVGSDRGVETSLVPEAGFSLVTLPGRGIERKVSLAALGSILAIIAGVLKGIGVMRRMRPAVVVVLGGYAAVPCIVGAVLWRIPMVVVARDARAGAADLLAGRFARASAVPFEGTDLPRAIVTGYPVRAEILALADGRDRDRACELLELPVDRVTIGVFTGSLGSRRVNEAVRGLVDLWRDRNDLAIRHVIGRRDWDQFAADLPDLPADGLVYEVVPYEDRMDLLLSASDVVVSRAGGSVSEIATVGVPSILVPLPIAPRDHQTFNAEALVQRGAAIRVPDAECTAERLAAELAPLVGDAGRRATMGAHARELAHPDAADRIAQLIQDHARP